MKFHPNTQFAIFETPLGPMLAAASADGLCGLWFEGQKHHPFDEMPLLSAIHQHLLLQKTKLRLDAYFDGLATEEPRIPFDLSLGTAFQQSVWAQLLRIPSGSLQSYSQLANALQKPSASRAVGAAVGKNPISLLIPCHRVIGASGALTGYAGGMDRKAWLLKHEGALL